MSLRITGSVFVNFRIENGGAKLRLLAVYFTILTIEKEVG